MGVGIDFAVRFPFGKGKCRERGADMYEFYVRMQDGTECTYWAYGQTWEDLCMYIRKKYRDPDSEIGKIAEIIFCDYVD